MVRFVDFLVTTIASREVTSSPMETAFGIAFILALLYLAPILSGFDNVIGILIIGFALWEAWRLNQRSHIEIKGPFRVKGSQAASG
jgi:hypothetical protein